MGILVCFLAYALWKTLQQWQSRAGLGDSPRTILDRLVHNTYKINLTGKSMRKKEKLTRTGTDE